MKNNFLEQFEDTCHTIESFLNQLRKSNKLQEIFTDFAESFFYANLIIFFFNNLTRQNVKEESLPSGQIGAIKLHFKGLYCNAKKAITLSRIKDNISLKDYQNFKEDVKSSFNGFYKIIEYLEDEIDFQNIGKFIKKNTDKFKTTGIESDEMFLYIKTLVLETHIEQNSLFPTNTTSYLNRVEKIAKETAVNMSINIQDILKKGLSEQLKHEKKKRKVLKKEIYETWKEPIDLLEGFILMSSELLQQYSHVLYKDVDVIGQDKVEVLIKLYARSIQVANEILVLIKAGYTDGAMARWRCLYEISVTILFLEKHENEISKRFLDHSYVNDFKETQAFKNHYRKLGYTALGHTTMATIRKNYNKVKEQYSNDFCTKYGWIPKSILKNRNLYGMEKIVNLDRFRPFVKLASNTIHSNASGFNTFGKIENYEDAVLIGPSYVGLDDPIQYCAISLLHISLCVLVIKPDFNSILNMKILSGWHSKIKESVSEIVDTE